MRIVALSDTHGKHNQIAVPDGDVLIHCGDITIRDQRATLESFGRWLGTQPHQHILVTWGNHDTVAEESPIEAEQIVQYAAGCEIRFLVNRSITIGGRVFYGAPYSNPFGDWAFMPSEAEQDNLFRAIPANADVVFTHGPPLGFGDRIVSGRQVGSAALRRRLLEVRPRYAFCGHIHEAYGGYETPWGGSVINCSVLDERYRVAHAPVVVDL